MVKKLALILFFFLLFAQLQTARASSFTNEYLRLANLSANSTLSGTVCAAPSSSGAGNENSVMIDFPSDFTISSNTSDWTTNTSNLPTGSSAWPGISANATSVSGKSVSFGSSDLTSTSLYCFNFTTTLSKTSASAGNDKVGLLQTKNGSTIIDETTLAISVTSNSQITITAGVDPQQSDLPIAIESTTLGSDFPQDTVLGYKITYGSNAVAPIPLTIRASWSQGTIDGDPTPSVDILNYVVGSATNAYNSTPAVVDTNNRTITWTIASFPGNTTGQTVTFSLKTTANYTGDKKVYFTVSANATSGSTVTPDVTVTQNYLFSGTAPTPTSAPGATLTPTPSPSKLKFTNISIRSLSKDSVRIAVSTNNDSVLTLKYGTSIGSLTKLSQTTTYLKDAIVSLTDLNPQTVYYFKITAKDKNGQTAVSDIFTFQTAIISSPPSIDLKSLVVVSSNVVLLNPASALIFGQKNIIVVPEDSEFTIQFFLLKKTILKSVQAIVRNKKVLGFSTISPPNASKNYVNLVETQSGAYTGKLAASDLGQYEIYVRLVDYNGNILEEKLADLIVTTRFAIFQKGSNKPVENARVLLRIYNQTSRTFEIISPNILPIQNPAYSTPKGRYDIILPFGKYKADITAIGYISKSIEFTIDSTGGYPTVYLEAHFDIVSTLQYYWNTLLDAFSSAQTYVASHSSSSRLFDLTAFGAILILAVVSIFSVSAKTHTNPFNLPYLLFFKSLIMFKKHKGRLVFGKAIEAKSKNPLSRVNIFIQSLDQKQTFANLKTNKLGEFYFFNPKGLDFSILAQKEGFQASASYKYVSTNAKASPFVLELKSLQTPKLSVLQTSTAYLESILGLFAEFFVIIGLLTQIFFIGTFGFLRVAPFIAITIANILLILLFFYKPRGLEKD